MDVAIDEINVLFVDDEKYFLNSIKRGLKKENYNTLFAECAEDAIGILSQYRIAVIVTDLNMPGIGGLALLEHIKILYPDIIRIIITGAGNVSSMLDAVRAGETYRYITKPVRFEEELIPIVRQSVELFLLKSEKQEMIRKIKDINDELKEKNEEIQLLRELSEKESDKKSEIIGKINNMFNLFVRKVITDMENYCGEDNDAFLRKKAELVKEAKHMLKFQEGAKKQLLMVEVDSLKNI